jgi:Predicted membrane protein
VKEQRKAVILQWIQIVLGLLVFAFGVHLTIYANIGLAPWDCLGMGISYHTPLNYGLSMTSMAVAVLLIDLCLRERIGFGTIIDALLTGNFVQMFNDLNPFPENHSLWLGVGIMLAGFVFMALGMYVYMKAAQCCGPRDSLLLGLGRRLPGVPIGVVEIMLWAVVLLAGWLLGGPVGIGTLISTFGAGAVMQAVYHVLRFEPREIRHRDVLEVARTLAAGRT